MELRRSIHGSRPQPSLSRAPARPQTAVAATVHNGQSRNHDDCETPLSLCTEANTASGEGCSVWPAGKRRDAATRVLSLLTDSGQIDGEARTPASWGGWAPTRYSIGRIRRVKAGF
jgi:hypothetical protein